MIDIAYSVHPSSFIDQPCEIGEGTYIWHFCHVMSGAKIGRNCSLGQNVMVAGGVKLGDNVKVQNNVSIFSGVTIEDDVFLGPSCVFTNVINPRSEINRKSEYMPTVVQRGATIGANATILCGVTIGCYAFIGAGAVVRSDVPDYGLMVGVPATQIGWMSRHGFRLPLSSPDGIMFCPQSGWRYRVDNGAVHCLDWPEEKPIS